MSKRSHADMVENTQSPFMPMFEHFRSELDAHHDLRNRTIVASRDITAASKKIIFTLQRIRTLGEPLPQNVVKVNKPYYDTIASQFASVSKDLQGLNAHRYARQISGGCQEYMEAASFEHYLATGELISYHDAAKQMRELDADGPGVELTVEDYLLGIFDTTGELMRFAITTMATNGSLPTIDNRDDMVDREQRSVLSDLRTLRSALESLNVDGGPFARDVEKKMDVMRSSVEKVEKSLYGLVVRGAERPKGWMPETDSGVKAVGVEG